jgi:hypothetical protein
MLEKHMTVLRKGPTMPLSLEMYQFEEETVLVNTLINDDTGQATINAEFTGDKMDQSSNYAATPVNTAAWWVSSTPDTKGTANDGTDLSMFYTPSKELKVSGDTIRIPIDIMAPGSGGQDWENGDQLIIEHRHVDVFGNDQKGTCRVEILQAWHQRGLPAWDQALDSPWNTLGCIPMDPTNHPGCSNYLPGDTWGSIGPMQNDTEAYVHAKIMSMSGNFPRENHTDADLYEIYLVQIPPLFKVKFPRFSYRYKYEDGEYSIFAPWSEIAFIPQKFDYSPKKGYNLGMENAMRSLKVLNWRPKNCPKEVVQIDILYKESNSPNIYTVESFKKDDPIDPGFGANHWNTPGNGAHFGRYTIKTELIHQVVASNQLLRPWDNVPRKALGQEITANRLIFANYLQQYDIESVDQYTNERTLIKPSFLPSVEEYDPWDSSGSFDHFVLDEAHPVKSLKSQRTYQLGVVYRDRYGRETPILTSKSGSVEIPKTNAKLQNRLSVQLLSDPPYWAESYTFYMKETANEYYNLAMDRWYDAKDGGVWLSFPSVERNKINEETNLILKKQHDTHTPTDYDVSYKILSIKNNAPKFIKTDNKYWGALPVMLPPPNWGDVGNWDSGMLYPSGLPLPKHMHIDVIAEYFDQSVLQGLTSKDKAQIRIVQSPGVPSAFNAAVSQLSNKTNWYDVANISKIGSPPQTYIDNFTGLEVEVPGQQVQLVRISLETAFGTDAIFVESNTATTALTASSSNLALSRGLILEARTREEKDKAQFEGRFFVKILRDANVESNIIQTAEAPEDIYQVLQSKDIKYICAAHPGEQDWNTPNKGWETTGVDISIAGPNNNVIPTTPTGNYEVSSYGPQVAGKGATYRNSGAMLGMPMPPPAGIPRWPFGPSSFTDGVYAPNTYYGDKYEDFLTGWNWPDSAIPPGYDWPSYAVGEWEPANMWGTVNSNAEYVQVDNGIGDYGHLSGAGIYPEAGVLDLSMGYASGQNGNGSDPTNGAAANTDTWLQTLATTTGAGYMKGANPFNVPAIWGDQSDFLDVGITGCNGGVWPNCKYPVFNDTTTTKLREDWYYLWRGRDDVDPTWPLGRFHPDRWFIDKVGAAGGYSGNGIWEDGNVSYMHLSYWGLGREDKLNRESNTMLAAMHQPTELKFADAMGTVGTMFRFKQDPDQTIYTITASEPEEHIWNYEVPKGSWAWDDGGTTVGGGGIGSGVLPPFGGNTQGNNLAGGNAFLSDVIHKDDSSSDKAKLTGGAPYNHRVRYTITLDKIIGAQGTHGFHPITNHVDADGIANIKRGRQKYQTGLPSGHITTAKGGTPGTEEMYNLASYWNATVAPGLTDTQDNTLAGQAAGQHIGLHERGLNETTIEIVSLYTGKDRDVPMSDNPAIFETEPKEDVGLDIYYAASPTFPIELKRYRWDGELTGPDRKTGPDEMDSEGANWYDFSYRGEEVIKVGSLVSVIGGGWSVNDPDDAGLTEVRVCGVQGDMIWLSGTFVNDTTGVVAVLPPNTHIRITWDGEGHFYGAERDEEWIELYITAALDFDIYRVGDSTLGTTTHNLRHGLSYFNCYSYGTGVESNRVRDDYNAVTIDKGVKASMPLAEQYEEERKGSGLIFSGIYNSSSGINRTNQFIQAEPITKDLNPINGSIQKLFTRDTDLVTFCENKVFKILAKKDALFNADGNTNVTSNQAVLGQSIPFVGEFGISRNPESFASESYRVYFADKDRGAVLRLSRDGITPISEKGMRDWFKDNLRFASSIIGSHDDREGQYNLTIDTADQDGIKKAYTVSYTEKKKGWVSFKSFIHQGGISHKNIYYTFPHNKWNRSNMEDPWGTRYRGGGKSHAETYQHHLDVILKRLIVGSVNGGNIVTVDDGIGTIIIGMNVEGNGIPIDTTVKQVHCDGTSCDITLEFTNGGTDDVFLTANTELKFTTARNRFYDSPYDNYSMVKVMFNGQQGSVKRYKTLNYEGTQSRVTLNNVNKHVVEGVQIGQDYYDNYPKLGWYVHDVSTDMQDGSMVEFINKENKWFNYIRGNANTNGQVFWDAGHGDFLDSGEFSLQGLGYPRIESYNCNSLEGCTDPGDGLGTYTTLSECQAACQQRWLCSEGACTELFVDPNLAFPNSYLTQQECIDGASSCGCYPCEQDCPVLDGSAPNGQFCISLLSDGTIWYNSAVDFHWVKIGIPFDDVTDMSGISGGAADDYGLTTSVSMSFIQIYATDGSFIPAGCGILTTISWDDDATNLGIPWATYQDINAWNPNDTWQASIGVCDLSHETSGDLRIGDFHQGGIIFYLDGDGGGLIVAPEEQASGAPWGCYGTLISGADGTGIGTGAQNTIDIKAGCTTSGIAADLCANLTLNGYSDWFLPSKDELNEMLLSLSDSAIVNTFYGNAVHWSSTEVDNNTAWVQDLQVGGSGGFTALKSNTGLNVRAIRAF